MYDARAFAASVIPGSALTPEPSVMSVIRTGFPLSPGLDDAAVFDELHAAADTANAAQSGTASTLDLNANLMTAPQMVC
jgi:hypothetical protein